MRLSVAISCMKDSLYGGVPPYRAIAVRLQQKCSMNFLALRRSRGAEAGEETFA